jgi:nitrite reductase (NO-forming)
MLAARAWLTLAALSLLLPEADRIGVWLPLHLALAGAVSTAISGAMQNFVLALTASPTPPEPVVVAQFVLVTAGAAVIALERILGHELGVALGGMLFLLGMVLLGWIVLRARRRSLHKRHALPLTMYAAAIVAILVGGTFGAVVGGGAVEGETWLGLRQAHMTVNVLGWVSLTIAGTLVTFLPTVLRIRMPTWHGWATVGLLVGGLAAIATGIAIRIEPLAGLGGVTYAAGALGVAWLVAKVLRTPRTWPVPVAAKHLLLAVVWFEVGALALAVALVRGLDAFSGFREPFLAIFVLGWAIQTLLGAWLYLLPMARPGHPDERRRQLAAIELGGAVQLLALNAGVLLLAFAGAGWASGTAGAIGAGLALGGGGLALLKAWTFAGLARLPALTRRHLEVWGA